ncbi:MAG: VCBS repeat-containing protein, partial [Candidatus Neomarinimicrobiota bacterium]|nr:VCBS repeat-containing protein [Candidatus Neomarinimicrobiota bacterium]
MTKRLFIVALIALFSCEKHPSSSNDKLHLSFTDISEIAGLSDFKHVSGAIGDKWFPESMGSGCGFIDYNSDGWIDILLVGGGDWQSKPSAPSPALFLYKNNKDGTFKNVTIESGLGEIYTYGFGVCVADYDNDSDQDFFFTTIWNNYLFRNDNGQFIDVSAGSGLEKDSLWSTTAIFFDANKDGFVDLFVGSYVDWSPENDIWCTLDGNTKNYCTPELYNGISSRFYQNNGNGTFIDKTEAAGFLPSPGKMLGAAELDFNNDGWPDLAVASDTQRDLLYQNNGNGTFNEIGAISGVAYDENG